MPLPYPYARVRDPLSLPAGFLRNQVAIQAQTSTQSSTGAPIDSWDTILTCFAGIGTLSQREVYQLSQFTALVSHRVTVRWPGASIVIQGGMQVLFGARIFKIQTVENVQERNRVLHLMCLEINGVQ